ncbi:MAG: Cys-tRNA(Pro) deacylase [Ignavibacteriaceae bacterium]
MSKTNVIRILESAGVPHTTHDYDVDEGDLSGVTVANKIGAGPESVFKTLVASGDKNGINVFCIPVTEELNLKKAASASGNKKIEMIKVKDLFSLTGYIRGGCSPIGMKKKFATYIDETALIFDNIYISAGVRGTQVYLSPEDLMNIIPAGFADLI